MGGKRDEEAPLPDGPSGLADVGCLRAEYLGKSAKGPGKKNIPPPREDADRAFAIFPYNRVA